MTGQLQLMRLRRPGSGMRKYRSVHRKMFAKK